ncbi:Guanylylate cyclase-domain-containing protein, partial [Jimgerdemannia flammicorona]
PPNTRTFPPPVIRIAVQHPVDSGLLFFVPCHAHHNTAGTSGRLGRRLACQPQPVWRQRSSARDAGVWHLGSRRARARRPTLERLSNWDCGLACVSMTLEGLGIQCNVYDLRRLCPSNSIWSVDLAFLLRNYVEDFTYYTSFLGSRTEYKRDKFYQDSWSEDQKRVNKLFAIAKSCNVHIVRMYVSRMGGMWEWEVAGAGMGRVRGEILPLDDFKRFLYFKKFVIIALVNMRLLRCQLCLQRRNCTAAMCGSFDSIIEKMKGYDYLGHFIVLINYDPTEDVFIYRDPAVTDGFCIIAAEDLDKARQSEGTDNDW